MALHMSFPGCHMPDTAITVHSKRSCGRLDHHKLMRRYSSVCHGSTFSYILLCIPLHNSTPFPFNPVPHPHTFFAYQRQQSYQRLQHTIMRALYSLVVIAIAMLYGNMGASHPWGSSVH